MPFNQQQLTSLPRIISQPRFSTYLDARGQDVEQALNLYRWNLEVSSALLVPLQICEVSIRNAVAYALEQKYGAQWNQSNGFIQSLPDPRTGHSPRQNLINTNNKIQRAGNLTAGKVIAELNFVFWEQMFTARHDDRLWANHFFNVFPNADNTQTHYTLRAEAHTTIYHIRKLRNRIAHNEPVFKRNIIDDYNQILKMIEWRCADTVDWVNEMQRVLEVNATKPI